MRKYVTFIMKYKPVLFILLVLSVLISLNGLRYIELNSDFSIFTPKDSFYKSRLYEMSKDFASSDQLMIQISYEETKMNAQIYEELVGFNEFLSESFDFITYTGPVDENTVQDITDQSIKQYEMKLAVLDTLAPVVQKNDKTYYNITLFNNREMTSNELASIENYLVNQRMTYAISGDTYMQLKVFDYILYILTRILPIAMVVLLIVFYSIIRTKKGTILSLLPAGIGSLWTMGLIGYIGEPISIITVLAPIFTLVIGSADGLHFITHIQEEQSQNKSTEEALTHTLQTIGVPMIITTITSIVGFLALMVMNTSAIINLAIFASVGIFFAGIAAWYVLPLILSSGLKLGYKKPLTSKKSLGLQRFWGKPVWVILIMVMIIFVIGALHIQQEFNMLSIYRPSTEVYKNNEQISDINGGTLPIFIYGDLPEGVDEQEIIKDVLTFEDGLKNMEEVGKVISGIDFMAKTGTQSQLATIDSSLMSAFINPDSRKFRIMVFPINHNNETLKQINVYVDLQAHNYSDYHFKTTGVSYMIMELNETMLHNQVNSSLLAIAIVFILLLITLKHLQAALISIVPIVLTLFMLFGMMGIMGISLNLISCTIFSITIGVGIDYAIHFTSIWRLHVKKGLSAEESTIAAYNYTARPIIANALGLSLGFSALFLSPLQIHVTVATLMWVAMVSSVVFSLIILPTLLRKIKV